MANICEKPSPRNEVEKNVIEEYLSTVYWFKETSKIVRLEIADCIMVRRYRDNEIIVEKGDMVFGVYVIWSGRVVMENEAQGEIGDIGKGNIIGGCEIINEEKYGVTYRSVGNSALIFITMDDYTEILKPQISQSPYTLLDHLHTLPTLTAHLHHPLATQHYLSSHSLTLIYSQNDIIYNFDSPAEFMYVVLKGSVRICVLVRVRDRNRWPCGISDWNEVCATRRYVKGLKVCNKGDIFGEKEMIRGKETRDSKAICISNVRVLAFCKEDFLRYFDRQAFDVSTETSPNPSQNISSQNRPTTREMEENLEEQLRKRDKIYKALLATSGTNSVPIGRGVFLDPKKKRRIEWMEDVVLRKRKFLRRELVGKELDVRKVSICYE